MSPRVVPPGRRRPRGHRGGRRLRRRRGLAAAGATARPDPFDADAPRDLRDPHTRRVAVPAAAEQHAPGRRTARTHQNPGYAPNDSPPTDATPACQGAVRYDLPLAETEIELLTSLCFGTGAVLRIQGIGPGLVTVDRPDLVSQQYEAGVVDIRFVRTGTVAVTIPKEGREHTITVVVR